ncbi:MAG: heavy metal translocating P-type ATPase [Clostridia bacterium]|nr:heavy metal translocating P-type ATPase [Clostridia bacterium]
MEQYNVTGMSCAACSARVEKAVSAVKGVSLCSVNLLTNSMNVEGTAGTDAIIAAVEAAGYGASLKSANTEKTTSASKEDALKDRETPVLKRRLFASLAFLAVLMYISMGHVMWNWPLPAVLAENPLAIGLLQMILAAIVMIVNQKFFIGGTKGVLHGAPNMDTLVALGSGASFVYSVYVLFSMTAAQMNGDTEAVMHGLHDFYFESAAMILTLITVGKMLEARAKGKTTDALASLMNLAPKTATVLRDGKEESVPVETVRKGDIFLVRPGEQIPVDGIVTEGHSAVNESALTGESIPVDKEIGDSVSSGTLNESGFLRCEATRVGEDTALSQIIRMVSDAAATKAPIAKIADKVSGIFVPTVIGIALVSLAVWLIAGETIGFALARAISVLVISCPCALGLATPVAIMVGTGKGAKNGILFKTAASLEEAGRVKTVVLDKTGTITSGAPKVISMHPEKNISETELLSDAYALEKNSEHPLAKAIREKAEEMQIGFQEVSDFEIFAGNGLTARLHEDQLYGGNLKFIETKAKISDSLKTKALALAEEGKTPLFFAKNGECIGMIAVADVIKEDSPAAIRELRDMGIRVVMLTGDNERTAAAIGKEVGVDEVIAGVMPDGKEAVIRGLCEKGKVAMVGDGINDAPALTRADIGIAIGAGTDIAIDAADIVLMKSRLSDVPAAIRLSRATLRNIHQNLFWAFFYNIIGIPLAAGVWYPLWRLKLSPMFGAAAMSLSSFCVVTNALRLNFVKIRNVKNNKIQMEENKMEKTMKIKGMMCGHCEARVKKCLEALPEVSEAVVSHKKNSAVVKLSAELADDVLKKTVEDQGYQVISIK